jgi:hypothetical protein
MKSLQKRAYRAVYMRPKVFLRFLRNVDSPGKLKVYGTGLWVLIKSVLPGSRGLSKKAHRVGKNLLKEFARRIRGFPRLLRRKSPGEEHQLEETGCCHFIDLFSPRVEGA